MANLISPRGFSEQQGEKRMRALKKAGAQYSKKRKICKRKEKMRGKEERKVVGGRVY